MFCSSFQFLFPLPARKFPMLLIFISYVMLSDSGCAHRFLSCWKIFGNIQLSQTRKSPWGMSRIFAFAHVFDILFWNFVKKYIIHSKIWFLIIQNSVMNIFYVRTREVKKSFTGTAKNFGISQYKGIYSLSWPFIRFWSLWLCCNWRMVFMYTSSDGRHVDWFIQMEQLQRWKVFCFYLEKCNSCLWKTRLSLLRNV